MMYVQIEKLRELIKNLSDNMAFKMNGMKFYGDRSRKEMRKDIQAERRTLKDGGATREEVKTFNQNQRDRKKEIRDEVKTLENK